MQWMKSCTKLVKAIESNDMATIQAYLTDAKATAEWTEKTQKKLGPTPLYVAAYNNNVDAIEFILSQGADIHARNQSGTTALWGAMCNAATEATQTLLHYGARADQDLNIKSFPDYLDDKYDRTKYYSDDENSSDKILDHISAYSDIDIIKTLLDRGACLNNRSLIRKLCLIPEFFDLYKDVLERGLKPEENKTILEKGIAYAICGKNTDIIEDLVARGIKCNRDALYELAKLLPEDFGIFRLLDSNDAIPGDFGPDTCEILKTAISAGNLEFLKGVAEKGVDINATDTHNTTALHFSIEKKNVYAVQTLSDLGARLDIYNSHKYTALSLAAEKAKNAEHDSPARAILAVLQKRQEAEKEAHSKKIIQQSKDEWERISDCEVSRVTFINGSQKRITDIFNFEAKQRLTIIDDLSIKAQGFMPREDFSDIPASVLQSAFDAYRRLEGPMPETEALSIFTRKDNAFFKHTPDNSKTGGLS